MVRRTTGGQIHPIVSLRHRVVGGALPALCAERGSRAVDLMVPLNESLRRNACSVRAHCYFLWSPSSAAFEANFATGSCQL